MKLTNRGMNRLYKLYTFLVYVIPMIALFIIKYDEFSSDGGTFGFWGIIVLVLCVLTFKNFCSKFFKEQPILSVSVVILIIGLFARFLSDNLTLIGGVSLFFGALSSLFSVVADTYEIHSYKLIDGEKQLNMSVAISQKNAWREAYGWNVFATNDNEDKKDNGEE